MTDFDETRRRRRKNHVVMQNKPRVTRVFFYCPDVTECNYSCTVEIPEGQVIRHRCSKCGKDMIAERA